MMNFGGTEADDKVSRCMICGNQVKRGKKLCDCCSESLILCDMDNYVAKKEKDKIYLVRSANAFK